MNETRSGPITHLTRRQQSCKQKTMNAHVSSRQPQEFNRPGVRIRANGCAILGSVGPRFKSLSKFRARRFGIACAVSADEFKCLISTEPKQFFSSDQHIAAGN